MLFFTIADNNMLSYHFFGKILTSKLFPIQTKSAHEVNRIGKMDVDIMFAWLFTLFTYLRLCHKYANNALQRLRLGLAEN